MGPYIDTYTMRPRAARDKWSDMGSAVLAMAENASKVSLVVFHPYKWSYGPLLVTGFLYPLRRECATYFSIVAGQRQSICCFPSG